jgi:hypothetical protein
MTGVHRTCHLPPATCHCSERSIARLTVAVLLLCLATETDGFASDDTPTYIKYAPIEFTFFTGLTNPGTGQPFTETDASPNNPWLDYRLDVELTDPAMTTYHVAGFYAGNGADAKYGPVGSTGSVWKARFAAFGNNAAGTWSYTAKLRYGAGVNIDPPLPLSGMEVWPLGGSGGTGTFNVVNPSAIEPEFLRLGFLRANGVDRYLQHDASPAQYFLKTGSGGPENFLGYHEFTGYAQQGMALCGSCSDCSGSNNVPPSGHIFAMHVADWLIGDASWGGPAVRKGKGIVGALNYLSSKGINSIFFMPMNLGGDGRDVFPFVTLGNNICSPSPADLVFHYSVARMAEWNVVFEHAMRKSILLEFVLAEREWGNIHWLGGSVAAGGVAMSPERKLFLKQMVAMFGHNPAIKWNLCEENVLYSAGNSPGQFNEVELEALAGWIRAWDRYQHPIGVHLDANTILTYKVMLDQNRAGWLDSTSLQVHGESSAMTGKTQSTHYGYVPLQARLLVDGHANSTRSVVVDVDENGSGGYGAAPDMHPLMTPAWEADATDRRRRVLYDVLFAGANLSWYYGYHLPQHGGGDIALENFRTRDFLFGYTGWARKIMLYPDTNGNTTSYVSMRAWDSILTPGCGTAPSAWDLRIAPITGEGFGPTLDGLDIDACDPEFGRPRVFAMQDGRVLVHYPSSTYGYGTLDLTLARSPGATYTYTSIWYSPTTGNFVPPRTLISSGYSSHVPPAPVWGAMQPSEDVVYLIEVNQ